MRFILNDQDISAELPSGMTVLDFVRYNQGLKGTKIGCREGDCGACTVLVGELIGEEVRYRSMTSCLMPLANAAEKHIVTIEGINPSDGSLTPVQQAMVDECGTQCGFCTVGFVMSLTGFCVSGPHVSTDATPLLDAAVSSIDGNLCRCTGYKSIERAALRLSEPPAVAGGLSQAIEKQIIPEYFATVDARLSLMHSQEDDTLNHPLPQVVPTLVAGGTDVYVQNPELMAETDARTLFYDDRFRGIRDTGSTVEIGGSATVTDLLESTVMQSIFPDLYKHLKLVSSTPIRNMATLAGNFANASPIGDMTVWFLALDAEIELSRTIGAGETEARTMPLKNLYRGYKDLAKTPDEIITTIRFRRPGNDTRFNFEKVSKRTYLDIATVNTAIQLRVETAPGRDWVPPVLSDPASETEPRSTSAQGELEYLITNAHVSAGGVAPIPLYLKETSSFLVGRNVNAETIEKANDIIQLEITPISDVRGSDAYKRLLLRQLFRAHFYEMFGV